MKKPADQGLEGRPVNAGHHTPPPDGTAPTMPPPKPQDSLQSVVPPCRRPAGDEIWEHKRGKVWKLVEKLELDNRRLKRRNDFVEERLEEFKWALADALERAERAELNAESADDVARAAVAERERYRRLVRYPPESPAAGVPGPAGKEQGATPTGIRAAEKGGGAIPATSDRPGPFQWPVGITGFRHPRAEGGPFVWTLLIRVGFKKRLEMEWR